jgi:hypothetical protein
VLGTTEIEINNLTARIKVKLRFKLRTIFVKTSIFLSMAVFFCTSREQGFGYMWISGVWAKTYSI